MLTVLSSSGSVSRILEAVSKRRTQEQKTILAAFDTHLSSYARAANISRNGLHVFVLESELLENIARRPRFLRSNRPYLVAIFGVVAGLLVFETASGDSSRLRPSEYEAKKEEWRIKLVEESVAWLVSLEPVYRIPWRQQKKVGEVRTSLTNLLKLFEV